MGRFRTTIGENGYSGGVISASPVEILPAVASPYAINSILVQSENGTPFPAKRNGCSVLNSTLGPGAGLSGGVLGMFDFYKTSTQTHIPLVVFASGVSSLRYNPMTGLFSTLSPSTMIQTTIDATTSAPSFSVANDCCFIVNGSSNQMKVLSSTIAYGMGITRPTVGTLTSTVGVGGFFNGTYEIRVTYVSTLTGHESSASNTATSTITVANKAIDLTNIPVSSDPQVNARYIYVRNTATMTQFFGSRAAEMVIPNNTDTTKSISALDTNLTIAAPTTSSNEPPNVTIRCIAYYKGRMFGISDSTLYWSQLGDPESWDTASSDDLNAQDGQKFTGLIVDHDQLIITKSDSFYTLNGSDPNTWVITKQDSTRGCMAHRTMVTARGWTWWWSRYGLVRWNGAGSVDRIGERTLGNILNGEGESDYRFFSGTYDAVHDRILMVRLDPLFLLNYITPWNASLGLLESIYWDPIAGMTTLSSGVSIADNTFLPVVFIGNANGQIFKLDPIVTNLYTFYHSDGMRPGSTIAGTCNLSGSIISTLVDTTASFDTSAAGLQGRMITLFETDGTLLAVDNSSGLGGVSLFKGSRPVALNGNTGTTIPLSGSIAQRVPGGQLYYIIGGQNFEWSTPWMDSKDWNKERYEYLLASLKIPSNREDTSTFIRIDFDNDDDNSDGKRRVIYPWPSTAPARTASTDAAFGPGIGALLWTPNHWTGEEEKLFRARMARVGTSWKITVINRFPDHPLGVMQLGMQGVSQTLKR